MRSGFLATALTAALVAAVLQGASLQGASPRGGAAAASFPNDDKTIIHALNRIGFGPRPADLEKVRTMGLGVYIEQQLRPDRIADPAMDARLSGLPTLRMSSRALAEEYERP